MTEVNENRPPEPVEHPAAWTNDPERDKNRAMKRRVKLTFVLMLAIMLVGGVAFLALAAFKKPPKEAVSLERALRVEVLEAAPADVPVVITDLGTVRALNSVQIAPEVPGAIVAVHPRLEVGEVIPSGEALFEIDPRTYATRVQEAEGAVEQWKSAITRLGTQQRVDTTRVGTLKRSRELAAAEFTRLKELFENEEVGTRSGVEAAERGYNTSRDQVDQLQQAVEVYGVQIQEAEASLKSAEARLEQTRIDLERTKVVAPFDARIKEVTVEPGQYVAPGAPIIMLADDSVLEISVGLNTRDVRKWLQFEEGAGSDNGAAWFAGLKQVPVTIRWTEDDGDQTWEGVLHRVERVDLEFRTITVAIRVSGENARSREGGLPLVEGMFCTVDIPGRMLHGVYKLPRASVSFENTVYKAVVDDAVAAVDAPEPAQTAEPSSQYRLHTVEVEKVHEAGDYVYVRDGLTPGELVVVTRLVNPLEKSLLEITPVGAEGA